MKGRTDVPPSCHAQQHDNLKWLINRGELFSVLDRLIHNGVISRTVLVIWCNLPAGGDGRCRV